MSKPRKLWFVGDWHLGEPRMKIMQRPFKDAQENYEVMRDNHNAVVSPDDLVVMVGDAVCMRQENPRSWLPKIDTFNGKKWLITGNHDTIFTKEELLPYFETIVPHGDGVKMTLQAPFTHWEENQKPPRRGSAESKEELALYVTHYPTRSVADRFNIVGHIHSAWKYQKNMLNVGVDVHHYRPMPSEDIAFYLTAITEFYDDDVWCANLFANSVHNQTRGKKGSYFKAE